MNDYFKRLMDSISHHHYQESSALLRIAPDEENEFVAPHHLRLIDLSFIKEEQPDLTLVTQCRFHNLNLADRKDFGSILIQLFDGWLSPLVMSRFSSS